MAATLLHKMFIPSAGILMAGVAGLVIFIIIAAMIAHFMPNTFEMNHNWSAVPVLSMAAGMILCLILIGAGQESPFLYFQF
jgi:hypothetical protein